MAIKWYYVNLSVHYGIKYNHIYKYNVMMLLIYNIHNAESMNLQKRFCTDTF